MFIWSSIAHFIALTSPGPDTAIVVRQVSLHGRRSGLIASFGIGIGIYLHCLLAINGISILILSNALYKFIISLVGSSYLLYLGIRMLKPINSQKNIKLQEIYSPASSFMNGFITNIFNIKAFIFFVSLFSVLIDSINGIFFYLYPVYFAVTTCLWFMLVSFLISIDNKSFNFQNNKKINLIMGVLLCLIGASILIKSLYEYF
tara:strand:- start:299 stop:907 length:609 start_codon:yes stop_codon:yes gene_type:complete